MNDKRFAHNPTTILDTYTSQNTSFQELMESNSLANLSPDDKNRLLKLSTAAEGRFGSLCSTLNSLNPILHRPLVENFVAENFGEDFGNSLLEIVNSERLTEGEKEQVLSSINSCRKSIDIITKWYYNIDSDDGELTKYLASAADESLTDIVSVFQKISQDGKAEVEQEADGTFSFSYESAIKALRYEELSLEIINETVQDIADQIPGAYAEVIMRADDSSATRMRNIYNLFSPNHGYVLLKTRAEGSLSFDPLIEYGALKHSRDTNDQNNGTEASIIFITNPVDPFTLPTPFKEAPRTNRDSPSLAGHELVAEKTEPHPMKKENIIEEMREKYKQGRVNAFCILRNGPVAQEGDISVNLSIADDGTDTPSGRIAQLIACGNKLRARSKQNLDQYNTEWRRWGNTEEFAKLVRDIETKIGYLAKICPPKEGEGLTASWVKLQMKSKKQRRGKKAAKSV